MVPRSSQTAMYFEIIKESITDSSISPNDSGAVNPLLKSTKIRGQGSGWHLIIVCVRDLFV